ncbi:hypothetical protein N7471_006605 [Penicillium samsonianum]|uniref:uncharacterized protein n=1 Tax=Penicillium samsonianum TaxID=1882272 RepID=UPI002549453E|nr:uncharacterized protein N7471_006605 [Penicillium samsonianum]KAJ6140119.1 hypothetical protein N7471_006605 [Penicillium samsonianum]
MFRKLRVSGSQPAPSAPATTVESKTVDPSPRAIHISDVRRSLTRLPRKPGSDPQSISIIVANAKGAADSSYLYSLLQREKAYGEFDPTGDFETDYLCDGHVYNVRFIPPNVLGLGLAYPLPHAACLPRLRVRRFVEGIVGRNGRRLREDA